MAKDLIVSIATSGRAQLLERTLASLERCRKPDIFRGVIIVENGPKGGAEDLVRSFGSTINAHYMYVPEPGTSRARNRTIEAAREIGENCLIFFTDDDVRIDVNTLCAYAAAAIGTDRGELYGGPVGVDYQVEPPEWLKAYLPPSAKGWWIHGGVQAYNLPYFLGCNWASFVKDLVASGGFNHYLGFGGSTGSTGEETDMQSRLLNNGVKGMYIPDANVWHYVPVERCSPKWAVRRIYLHEIESGLRDVASGLTFLGFCRTLLFRTGRLASNIVKGSLRRDKKAVFLAFFRFARFCGRVRGSLLARKLRAKASQEMER